MANKPANWRSLKLDDLFDLPKSKKAADLIDSEYYFTQEFCAGGHFHIRRAKDNRCVLCAARDNGAKPQPAYYEEVKTLEVFGIKIKLGEMV